MCVCESCISELFLIFPHRAHTPIAELLINAVLYHFGAFGCRKTRFSVELILELFTKIALVSVFCRNLHLEPLLLL